MEDFSPLFSICCSALMGMYVDNGVKNAINRADVVIKMKDAVLCALIQIRWDCSGAFS